MSFIRTDAPPKIVPHVPFSVRFWFKNTGGGTARQVHVNNLETLEIWTRDNQPVACNSLKGPHKGGPADIPAGEPYSFRPEMVFGEDETIVIQIRASIDYIATDSDGRDHPYSLPFCAETFRDPMTKHVSWLHCFSPTPAGCTDKILGWPPPSPTPRSGEGERAQEHH
jgi:hypothetical protein